MALVEMFNNVSLIKSPTYPERLIFACDDLYFLKYGVYHILSCNLAGHHVHCHVINPSEETIQTYEKIVANIDIDLSFSTESVSLTGWPLRSYYYSRSFSCPTGSSYYSLSTYVYAGDSYTYSSRQYCSIYREYYYDRLFKCSKANQGGPIGGGVGGAVAFVVVCAVIYCIYKKKQAEKNAQQVQASTNQINMPQTQQPGMMMGQPMMQPMMGQPMMAPPMMMAPQPMMAPPMMMGQPMMGQPMMGQPMMQQPAPGPIVINM